MCSIIKKIRNFMIFILLKNNINIYIGDLKMKKTIINSIIVGIIIGLIIWLCMDEKEEIKIESKEISK